MVTSSPVRVPTRPEKPRTEGLTSILDSGLGLAALRDLLEVAGPFIDIAKIGWATSLVLSDLSERLALYRSFGIDPCFGGTLFEYVTLTDQLENYRKMLQQHGIEWVEVSDGSIEIDEIDKLRAIERLSADFRVLSEVGSKDSSAIVSPARWVRAITNELDAGASIVILEGREAGNAGLYRSSGEMRTGLVDEIIEAGIPKHQLLFEAPLKQHQVYLIQTLGPEVNLGNIAPDDAVPLETLRLGLRSDTLLSLHGGA